LWRHESYRPFKKVRSIEGRNADADEWLAVASAANDDALHLGGPDIAPDSRHIHFIVADPHTNRLGASSLSYVLRSAASPPQE
jgi:hypothetical protein